MRKALGKGLGALIPDAEFVESIKLVEIEKLERNPFQPRDDIERNIDNLVESIKTHGILEPILVRKSGDKYVIVAGERRYLAAKKAGLDKVPVRVLDVNDSQMAELALVENLLREDLNPLEEAQGIETLIEKFNYTHEKVAEVLGVDRVTVTNKLRLLKLSEPVKKLLRDGAISEGHAKLLVSLPEEEQLTLGKIVAEKGLSVRELEKLLQKKKADENRPVKVKSISMISRFPGVRVTVSVKPSGEGQILIKFKTKDEFLKIAELLQLKPESPSK
ncbi:MAG: ParB/RepB/Spo0J family partition protein [Candidatus Hydrothermia bacterium]